MKFMKINSRENRSSFGIQVLIEHGYNSFRRWTYMEYHKEEQDWYIFFQQQNYYRNGQSTNHCHQRRKKIDEWAPGCIQNKA